jgi:mono/diheme cytochrome c family protein
MLEQDCLACHSESLVRQQRLTPAQWAKSNDKMRKWGAPIEQEEVEPLAGQLAAAYGLHAGPYRPASLSAAEAASLFTPLPDGPFAGGSRSQGRAVYADRCEPCHGSDGRGGDMGTCLAGRLVLDRAPDLAATVRAGRGRMPAWPEATDADLGSLLAYLRSLPIR